ncbi:MAG: HlyD family efflux transporter periplasmic adaptor subunit [Rhodobacteraceae bacterium]|nr:HlyD family efflux transporter periplasmic adaptor subunit [Paracoccaceae bacterium]
MTQSPAPDLPTELVRHDDAAAQGALRRHGFRRRARWLLLLLLLPPIMFSGAVMGMYFQPLGLKKFYQFTGLTPGGGSAAPIALPPNVEIPKDMAETMQVTDVVGLARLMPKGDIVTVAPPYGAGDARIAEILVREGQHVEKGTVIARLDNAQQLQGTVLSAEASMAVREATLVQTRATVLNSGDEARAALAQAEAASVAATADLARVKELHDRGVATQAALDAVVATERQSALAVEKARATLARFSAADINSQPDVIVAKRNLDAARADLERAQADVLRADVLAPITGVVLEINARPGEKPPATGIMQMGDTSQMMAEAEIYQDRVAAIAPGQAVELASVALGQTLRGRVQEVGLIVGRQGLIGDDTAANTDARVVKIRVALDPASSKIAARYTNLEVIARIDTRATAATP